MSALNPLPSSGPSAEKRVYEPSMEEILASIRRIIADDQSLPSRSLSPRDPESPVPAQDVEPSRFDPPHSDRPHVETSDGGSSQVDATHATTNGEYVGVDPAPVAPTRIGPLPGSASPLEPDRDRRHASAADAFEAIPLDHAAPLPSEPARSGEHEPRSTSGSHPVAHGAVTAPQYAAPGGPQPPHHHGYASAHDELTRQEPGFDESAFAEPAVPLSASVPPDDRSSQDDIVDPAVFDEPVEPQAVSEPAPPSGFAPLFSNATDSSVSSAFNLLAASRLAANSDEIMGLVREMIRPLLRNWLDDNLPSMVERMVRDEIERVARGGR